MAKKKPKVEKPEIEFPFVCSKKVGEEGQLDAQRRRAVKDLIEAVLEIQANTPDLWKTILAEHPALAKSIGNGNISYHYTNNTVTLRRR